MKIEWVFLAMYEAAKVLNKEEYDEEMDFWVDDANPYVREGRVSIVPRTQEDFYEYARENGFTQSSFDPEDSRELVLRYVHEKMSWGERFDDISETEWERLYELIQYDENQYYSVHIRVVGVPIHNLTVPAIFKGKTLKSIEYVKVNGQSIAQEAIQLNMGSFFARLVCIQTNEMWVNGSRSCMRFFGRADELASPLTPKEGIPHAYMVDEVVTGAEVILYAVGADGYDGILGVHMGITLRTRYGVHCFYRRGMTSNFIYVTDHVPSDEELGFDEVRSFWSAGTEGFTIVRDDWVL